MVKPEIRIIAWDDCAFSFKQKRVLIVGAVFRGGSFLDGMLSTRIAKDGSDATEKIARSINKSRHHDQLSVIMLDGITFAGFNIVDIAALNRKTALPVIVILRKRPDIKKFTTALKIFGDNRKRAIKTAGRIYSYRDIFYQKSGISRKECGEILKITCTHSKIPEPIRAAHLIASGLSGESHGHA